MNLNVSRRNLTCLMPTLRDSVFTPEHIITNDELVEAFNAYADRANAENADAIAAGEIEAIPHSSADFIVAASGIENRYVLDKEGVLDPSRTLRCVRG